jgi:Tol biopolymer transport system component
MSPDGRRILFNKFGSGYCGGVWIMTLATFDVREIVRDGCNATWSPDGSRIVFSIGNA